MFDSKVLLGALVCCGWIFSQATSAAQVFKGGLNMGRVSGVFTVADFRSVNGTTMAAGWLTGNVTDQTGTNEIGVFTNFPIRLPISGVLAGDPIDVEVINNPVTLPQLSTNTCTVLGVVVGAIDLTVPGIGLNLHVNEISVVVRADRETTVGELLCALLGDGLLGTAELSSGSMPNAAGLAGSTENLLTIGQLHGLMPILLGLADGADAASLRLAAPAEPSRRAESLTKGKADLDVLQSLLNRVTSTLDPSAAAPAASLSSPDLKSTEPAKAAELKRLSGAFTVSGFQVVNGVTEAVGLLTTRATDTAGLTINIATNIPVRLPVVLSGPLAAKAKLLTSLSTEAIPPPRLGTNLCKILGVEIEFIDVVVPGLGLNVHVNEISLAVLADRDTVLGDILCTLLGEGAYADLDAVRLRSAAQAAGLNSLATVPVPQPDGLDQILNVGAAARTAAVQLGKSLFWDMQVGSDGIACASCHNHAGADRRTRNQLNPGSQRISFDLRTIFNDTPAPGVSGGPDYTLTELDFPLRQFAARTHLNFNTRVVTFDTDDVVSSMGVFAGNFTGIAQPLLDGQVPDIDAIFNLGNPQATTLSNNVRRSEGRNTPTMINAVFTHANFWDGRAHNLFNGVSAFGPLDTNAAIWVNTGAAGTMPIQQQVRIANASLASQAVGPVTGEVEMSFHGRTFRDVAVKLLRSGFAPLGQQVVHASDSVLGPLSRYPDKGLNTSYTNLIMQAFQPKYWNGSQVMIDQELLSQMEANFTFFFGLAIQLYESTLVSDQTPFDRFMAGDYNALSQDQLRGLLIFMNQGLGRNPPLVETAIALAGVPIGQGNCVSCHAGPEFTAAALTHLRKGTGLDLTGLGDLPVLLNGLLSLGTQPAASDIGFANIGVRSTVEDLARGRMEGGFPLAFVRQALSTNLHFLLPSNMEIKAAYPTNVQVDGAFKIPGLRNVELTGPYFHNGGQATLAQVVEFYRRHGDFGDVNLPFLDRNLTLIAIEDYDEEPLVKFLLALTDERVRLEQAPFDHPQILLPDGGTFTNERPFIELPAVGAGGRLPEGLPPLDTFLDLPPLKKSP